MNEQYKQLGVSDAVLTFGEGVLADLTERFSQIDAIAEANQLKVINAMQKNRVAANHFNLSTGYGYDDEGRDTLERVYADCFGAEAALVRPQITCGTHALALALGANLLPGDELLSPVGAPYDTLEEVIGIRESVGSLKEYGVSYRQVDLLPDGSFDLDGIRAAINEKTKLVTIQRSKGYATRPSFSVEQIGQLIAFCKLLRRVHRADRAGERGRGHDGGQPYQESWRRVGSHRRLYLRPRRPDRAVRPAAHRAGSWPGGGRQSGAADLVLSGFFPGAHGGGLRCEGRGVRRRLL